MTNEKKIYAALGVLAVLGGALYEVLAKRAPHDAPNALLALVASVARAVTR